MNVRAEDLPAGYTIAGRYTVTRKLGEGGMGSVYLATQQPLGREVVLKVLHKTLRGAEDAAVRFESEAHAVSRLNHPNIVTIYDFGSTEDGTLYIAMEYVSGTTLHAIMRHGPVQPERAQFFVESIARALAEAHAHGIVHRDLKPENIMLCETATEGTTVKVLDFGIAKMQGDNADSGQQLTEQDVIVGTPGYMSPEQIQGQPVDGRADLYCLGVIWWELLIGRAALSAESPIHVLVKHLNEAIPPPSQLNPNLKGWTPHAEALLMSLLSKQADGRPPDGGTVVQALRGLEVNDWSVQSVGQAGQVLSQVPTGADVDDFFAGDMSNAPAGFPSPSPASLSPPSPSPAEFPAAPAVMDAHHSAAIDPNHLAGPSDDAGSPVDPEEPSFESLGGGSSAYAMMMNDIYGDDDEGAPLPGGNPFAIEPSEEEKPKANLFVWRVEIDGLMRDNIPLVEVRELIAAGKITAESDGAPQGEPLAKMGSYPPFQAAFSAKQLDAQLAEVARETSGPKTPARAQPTPKRAVRARPRSRGKMVTALGAGALVVAGGYLGFVNPELGSSLWTKVRTATGTVAGEVADQATDRTPLLIEAHAANWKEKSADARSAKELIEEGDQLLVNPTPQARVKANDLYRKAVVSDPRSSEAVGALIENLAFLPTHQRELLALSPANVLTEATGIEPHVRLVRAQAALALADGRAEMALRPLKTAAATADSIDGVVAWMLAEAYLAGGDVQAAIGMAAKAKEARSQDSRVDLTLAKIARRRLNLDAAQAALAKRRVTTDADRQADLESVMLEIDNGRAEDAAIKARALVEASPNDDTFRLAIGRIFDEGLGDRAGALEVLRGAGPLEKGASAAARATLMAYRATVAFEAQQSTRAKADLARAVKLASDEPLVLFAQARALLRDGRFDAARDAAEAAVKAAVGKPYESDVLVVLADTLIAKAGRSEAGPLAPERIRATRLYRKALDKRPANLAAFAGLLTAKCIVEQLKPDSDTFVEAVTALVTPTSNVHFAALAPDTSALARHARAIRKHRVTAEPIAKRMVSAYIDVVRGRRGVAVKTLRKIVGKRPREKVAAMFLAALYLDSGKVKYARSKLRKAEVDAQTPISGLLLAQAEARLGNVEAASALLSGAVERRPPPGMMAETEAYLIEARDDDEGAALAWRAVLDVASGSKVARQKLMKETAPPPKKKSVR